MTIEITQKAQSILDWLKNLITKRYIKSLKDDEKKLSELALISMAEAINNGLINRSEDEIKIFNNLKATKILLSNLPYDIFIKSEKNEELNKEDIEELENFFDQLSN